MLSCRILLTALVVVPCLAAAQKVTLRWNPPAGKTYTFASTMDMQSMVNGMDMGMKQSSTMTMKVLSNKAGKVTLQTKLSDVKVTVPPKSMFKSHVDEMQRQCSKPPPPR